MNLLDSLDRAADGIQSFYVRSGFIYHNRIFLGIFCWVAVLVSPFMGIFSGPGGVFGFFLFLGGALFNTLFYIAGIYLGIRGHAEEQKESKNPFRLRNIATKIKVGRDLTIAEEELYLQHALEKATQGDVEDFEFAFLFARHQDFREHTLFRTTDEELLRSLSRLRPFLSQDLFHKTLSQIPARLSKFTSA